MKRHEVVFVVLFALALALTGLLFSTTGDAGTPTVDIGTAVTLTRPHP